MMSSDTVTIVLVNCGGQKANEPVPAKDLYTSGYFTVKRLYAEDHGDRWAILSAKHHLLDPDRVTDPYEKTMDDVDDEQWADRVMVGLRDLVDEVLEANPEADETDIEIRVVATKDYYEPLRPRLQPTPWTDTYPLEGMGLFDQMEWLSDRLSEHVKTTEEGSE